MSGANTGLRELELEGYKALLKAFLRHPLLTFKVVAGIHVEALWLFLKRVGVRRHVAVGADGVSIVAPDLVGA